MHESQKLHLQNISALMSGWTKQMGFPVVTVSQTVNGSDRQLHLKQSRFIADGGQDGANSIWQASRSLLGK